MGASNLFEKAIFGRLYAQELQLHPAWFLFTHMVVSEATVDFPKQFALEWKN